MKGNELYNAAIDASDEFGHVVARVCGQCEFSCCHSGTMVGSQGMRRLYKGVQVDPEVRRSVGEVLQIRAREMIADLDTVDEVMKLMEPAYGQTMAEEMQDLRELREQWREFAEWIGSGFELAQANLDRIMLFSAIRSNLLRKIHEFPGAEAALANFTNGDGTFHYRRRRLAPPRCFFHADGCQVGRYKPITCANFFCTGDPNLLEECQREMSFDEFVLANMYPESIEFVRQYIRCETELGQAYWEPKIIFAADETVRDGFEELIGERDCDLEVRREGAFYAPTADELLRVLTIATADASLLITAGELTGAALYEIAIALQRAMSSEVLGGVFIIAESYREDPYGSHALWSQNMMSQPLGSLDVFTTHN